jgi:hypothetical protein
MGAVVQSADTLHYDVLSLKVETGGNFLAYELQTENAWVKASTASQVKVYARRLLNANASGKSFIAYRGEPAVKEFTSSLGGEISPQTE